MKESKNLVCKKCGKIKTIENYSEHTTYLIYCKCGYIYAYLETDLFK